MPKHSDLSLKLNNMFKQFVSVILIISGLLISCQKSTDKILKKSISRLNSIETIEYEGILDYVHNDFGIKEKDTAICYFDFTSEDSLIGARFQFVYKNGEQVFNGQEEFSLSKTEERVVYNKEPMRRQLFSPIAMLNSMYFMRKLIPEFLTDTSIVISKQNDTLINGVKNYSFNISIKNGFINGENATIAKSTEGNGNYYLFISTKSYLPTQFIFVFHDNKGYTKTTFSNINLSASRAESIWEFDRFPKDYLHITRKELNERMRARATINVGQIAPNWSLPSIEGDSVRLSKLKGSIVLLEFWFPNCGGCVLAIPEINSLQDIYSHKGLKIYGIEFSKSDDKGLRDYIKERNIKYPTLHTGKNVAKDYGVYGAPTFFLIDKKGLIVYSSAGLNKEDLINTINDNIK